MSHALALAMLSASLLPAAASAAIIQFVSVERKVDGVTNGFDQDMVNGLTPADITRDILAQIGAPQAYSAIASAGRFGSIGVSAGLFQSGDVSLRTDVRIASDFVNLTGVDQHGTANFVIDGGSMLMVAARNAGIQYSLNVTSHNVTQGAFTEFDSFGSLVADDFGAVSFFTSGADIGATFDPTTGRVSIPPSFQTLDLGTIAANDILLLTYDFRFFLNVGSSGRPGASEGLGARFSDPLNLGTTPVLGPIQLTPVSNGPPTEPPPAAVPEPSTLTLCALGAAGWAARRRLSRT